MSRMVAEVDTLCMLVGLDSTQFRFAATFDAFGDQDTALVQEVKGATDQNLGDDVRWGEEGRKDEDQDKGVPAVGTQKLSPQQAYLDCVGYFFIVSKQYAPL